MVKQKTGEKEKKVYIGPKDISKYLSACFFALGKEGGEVEIIGRGNNVKRSVDVGAILLRQYIDKPDTLPTLSDVEVALENEDIGEDERRYKRLLLIRNFLGGLTNLKIIELYKQIKLSEYEAVLGHEIDKREKFWARVSIKEFEKKLGKYNHRVVQKEIA